MRVKRLRKVTQPSSPGSCCSLLASRTLGIQVCWRYTAKPVTAALISQAECHLRTVNCRCSDSKGQEFCLCCKLLRFTFQCISVQEVQPWTWWCVSGWNSRGSMIYCSMWEVLPSRFKSGIGSVYNTHAVHVGRLPKKRAVNVDIFPLTGPDFCVWLSVWGMLAMSGDVPGWSEILPHVWA